MHIQNKKSMDDDAMVLICAACTLLHEDVSGSTACTACGTPFFSTPAAPDTEFEAWVRKLPQQHAKCATSAGPGLLDMNNNTGMGLLTGMPRPSALYIAHAIGLWQGEKQERDREERRRLMASQDAEAALALEQDRLRDEKAAAAAAPAAAESRQERSARFAKSYTHFLSVPKK